MGVHICHILNQWLRRPIVIYFQPIDEMKMMVKIEGIYMVKETAMSFGTNLTCKAQRALTFVLMAVPQ